MYLNFSDIPGHHELFLDYIGNFEGVKRFYGKHFRDEEIYEPHFNSVLEKYTFERDILYNLLKKQYIDVKPSEVTESNINLLRENNTLAVITGQQLGIGGGPMYTLYKIITAIKLTRQLKENHNDFNFVPIFWLEGDDHDFDEIKSLNIFAQNNTLTTISYDDGLPEEDNRGNMGVKEFGEDINNFLSTLKDALRPSEFTEEIMAKLKSAYFEGTSFKDAFFDLLFDIFDEYGLIIFDPTDKAVKEELSSLFLFELDNYRSHADKLVLRSAELEETYHAQVKIRPINLFIIENKERLAIEPADEGYRLKGKRTILSKEELLKKMEDRPDKVSPNVIMRPICQDYLFPTAFYIGGPSEISYFAQIIAVYESFNIEPPILYPRSSATILEKNIKEIISRYNLELKDIYTDEKELSNQVIHSLSDNDLEELFSESDNQLLEIIDRIKKEIVTIDPNMGDIADKAKQRIQQTTSALRAKTENAQKKKFEIALRQIDKAAVMLYPGKNLQEREINFIYYANKYGMDFLKWLFNELSINKFQHQYLEI